MPRMAASIKRIEIILYCEDLSKSALLLVLLKDNVVTFVLINTIKRANALCS